MDDGFLHVRVHLAWHLTGFVLGIICAVHGLRSMHSGESLFPYIEVTKFKNTTLFWAGLTWLAFIAILCIVFGLHGIVLFMLGE
jgi:hypothetical protein